MNRDAYARELDNLEGHLQEAMNVSAMNNPLIFAQELKSFYELGAKVLDMYLPPETAAADVLEEGVKAYEAINGDHSVVDNAGKIMVSFADAKSMCKKNNTEKSLEKFSAALVICEHVLKESTRNNAMAFTPYDR